MKALVLIASALFAFTASAGEYSMSKVTFQAAATWVNSFDVCRDGDFLKHKTKATVEVSYCNDKGHNCKIVSKPLIQPVVSTAQRCAPGGGAGKKDGCQVWETYTFDQSSVPVWTAESRKQYEEGNYKLAGKYVIPACKTGGGVAN